MDESLAQKILDAVDEQKVIDFARALVRIPSYTTEETRIARYIAHYMQQNGIAAELQEVPTGKNTVSHNVVGRLVGTGGGPTLLLIGHMDHGPTFGREFADLDRWEHDPFGARVEDGWLYGEGTVHGKGGITGMVMAAETLVRARVGLKGDVIVAPLAVHFLRSAGTVHLLKSGVKGDFVIDTAETGSTIAPTFVGRSQGKIEVEAPELHPHTKEVLPDLRNRLTAFELMHEIQGMLGPELQPPGPGSWMTFEPHPDLQGYPQIHMQRIASHGLGKVSLEFQVRVVPGMSDATIHRDLRRLLDALEQKYPYLKTDLQWPAWETRLAVETSRDSPLVRSLAQWHEYATATPASVTSLSLLGGSCDASHAAGMGADTVAYGPGGAGSDREYRLRGYLGEGPPDERVALKDLVATTKVLALTMADLCGVEA